MERSSYRGLELEMESLEDITTVRSREVKAGLGSSHTSKGHEFVEVQLIGVWEVMWGSTVCSLKWPQLRFLPVQGHEFHVLG